MSGASIAGLIVARVLADHFERVTVVERDAVREHEGPRKGVPQGRHLHGLQARGLQVLEQLFPGIGAQLRRDGATPLDMGRDLHWFQFGGYKATCTTGLVSLGMTRPFLESHVRARLLEHPRIELRDACEVEGWRRTGNRVQGLHLRRRSGEQELESLDADLVVDASGRGSRTPRWLEEAGFARPHEVEVIVDVGYATRMYEQADAEPLLGKALMTYPHPPHDRRMGAAFPIEGGRWIVSLGGWGGDTPPHDDAGYQAFARSLPRPDIAELLERSTPVSPIEVFRFRSNLWRRYDLLPRWPARLVVLGDAVCSFNPIYGQGMTSTIMQALELGKLLQRGIALDFVGARFGRAIADLLAQTWQMSTSEDFRFPTTTGPRPPGTAALHWFGTRMIVASQRDPIVYETFLRTMNLLSPRTALLSPRMLARIMLASR